MKSRSQKTIMSSPWCVISLAFAFACVINLPLFTLGSTSPQGVSSSSETPQPVPLAFKAKVEVYAHRLDKKNDYPPSKKVLSVWYDQPNGRLRVEFLHTKRTLIRRYDTEEEFLITRLPGFPTECQKSKVMPKGSTMPLPDWPAGAKHLGQEKIGEKLCNAYREQVGDITLDLYLDAKTHAPVRARVSTTDRKSSPPTTEPDVTYDVVELEEGPVPVDAFALPDDHVGGVKACERRPHDIGFPYVHLFHYVLRA